MKIIIPLLQCFIQTKSNNLGKDLVYEQLEEDGLGGFVIYFNSQDLPLTHVGKMRTML